MNNKKKQQIRKLTTAVLAVSIMASSPVYAADLGNTTVTSTTSDNGLSFSDVSAQHWAIKHITKLASLGIIQGFEKKEFRPEISVSQQDVIIMVIRMMGLEQDALKNKAETVLPVLVSDYAKPYIAYAFDKQIIVPSEEVDGTAAKSSWGAREATREWVAKLVIRAIGKQDLAKQQAANASTFSDAGDFSTWANGYVNAAVQLKIVQGMDGNTFQPKGKVTRAQMATFLSRADKELTTRSDRVAIGYLMGQTGNKISLMNAQGDTKDYTLSADTPIYNAKDDTRIPLSSIKLTNEVYVVQNQGNAVYVELTNDQQKLDTYEGTLNEVYLDQMIVSLQQGGQKRLYEIAANVAVTDKDGRGLSIGSIAPGSTIALQKNSLLKDQKITQIIVKQVPISKSAEGTILGIDKDKNQITLLEKSLGQNEVYTVSTRTAFTMTDGSAADFTKVRVGDTIAYEVKNGELTSVAVRKQADYGQTVQGKLISLSEDKTIMTITKSSGTTLDAYYVADNVQVTIDGLASASLYDIEAGDDLKVDLLNNKVVGVSVTNRSIKQYVFASILSYDQDAKVLTITADNGSVAAYKLADTTTIKFADSVVPLSNFTSMFSKGKKVDLKVSKDKVVSLALTVQIDGTVALLNTATGDITIRTASGQSLPFKISSGMAVDMLNRSGATVADLKVGDTVSVGLAISQDFVTSIMSKKIGVFKTTLVNSGARQLTVKDETGAQLTFLIDSNDKIVNPGKATHAFEDIQVDDYVKANFNGSQLTQLVMLKTVRGKVTSVDATLGTITVQDYQGGVQVLPVGQQFTVKANGATSSALSTVKVNDRVEVSKDVNDKMIINVAATAKRTIASYDYVLNLLQLKPTAAGDKTTYNFYAKAYLHQGTQAVAASTFVENDEVNVYVLDDKIMEIEKN
ncbi:S-layer homology domain-containing protein [Paenibacillus cremeus]|uniref:S-layer homology domain-containing protein n=1 Tax=Paenibacillus cremeus TaxID=2163881 RepID=A0A559KHQ9_9BACL|nr:S-layer homology domain-containing protein [Paenibacillus cremeus]TVY11661.1 S-layer homology domain-containing protein [Paenibacillus cremeus]